MEFQVLRSKIWYRYYCPKDQHAQRHSLKRRDTVFLKMDKFRFSTTNYSGRNDLDFSENVSISFKNIG